MDRTIVRLRDAWLRFANVEVNVRSFDRSSEYLALHQAISSEGHGWLGDEEVYFRERRMPGHNYVRLIVANREINTYRQQIQVGQA